MDFQKKEPLLIKRRADDEHRMISVRMHTNTLAEIDRIASETRRSRNQVINMILEHGVKNIQID